MVLFVILECKSNLSFLINQYFLTFKFNNAIISVFIQSFFPDSGLVFNIISARIEKNARNMFALQNVLLPHSVITINTFVGRSTTDGGGGSKETMNIFLRKFIYIFVQ